MMDFNSEKKQVYLSIFILAILANLSGLLSDIFLSDSALYAAIAKEMVVSNNFINLTFDGVDWLDKPHFPFWITAFSFKIFGINTFAYKLPAILFSFLAFYYTYRLAKDLYNKNTALLAVLILATAEHLVISNNDVRAEPYLTGLIIASVYYYHRMIREMTLPGRAGLRYIYKHMILASLFAGLAVMTKGLFTLIPILGAVGGELILKRRWNDIFNWRWILSGGLIFLFVTPELYALYQQFDIHPEKVVFGETGVSGIRFFIWDSQFGRFFNTGPIKGKGDPFFFLHTLLWAFIPWCILMYWAVFKKIRGSIPRINLEEEFYTISGSLLTILVFSLSSFQLPHYTNIIFPFLAILTAQLIMKLSSRREILIYSISQYTLIFMMVSFPVFLMILFRPEYNILFPVLVLIILGLGIAYGMKFRGMTMLRVFLYTCLASFLLNFFLNLVFYPQLLQYQSGTKVAEYANTQYPGEKIRVLGVLSHTIHFVADSEVKNTSVEELANIILVEKPDSDALLYTVESYLNSLDQSNIKYDILEEFEHFHITKLNGTFINHKTREDAINNYYLLRIWKGSDPAGNTLH